LAIDHQASLVVIELKVDRGHEKVVGQICRYIAWIRENLADEGQHVRGIIIGHEVTEDLRLACSMVKDVSLREYSISFSLNQVN
ncbi:MAG TPA: DUF91 domain-containing protein, partial [Candidatus Poseidoniales archaeon]|nr:DUF91 domain-containing protein [Candidatus Poseidoniales archaeon]